MQETHAWIQLFNADFSVYNIFALIAFTIFVSFYWHSLIWMSPNTIRQMLEEKKNVVNDLSVQQVFFICLF